MRRTRLVLPLLAIAIVALISYQRAHSSKAADADPSQKGHSISVDHSLALGDFVVAGQSSHDVRITTEDTAMRNARLTGHFSTQGNTTIQVLLLDGTQYGTFQKHQVPSGILYMSKAISSGDIEVALPRNGAYYLVFDNSSSQSPANVKADVTLHYEIGPQDSNPDHKK